MPTTKHNAASGASGRTPMTVVHPSSSRQEDLAPSRTSVDDVLDPDVVPPPADLRDAGRLLWESILGAWDIDTWERLQLHQACRVADRLDALAEAERSAGTSMVTNTKGELVPHPALVESRQQAIVLTRLLASMRLPVGDEDDVTRPQRRGGARGTYTRRAGLRGGA